MSATHKLLHAIARRQQAAQLGDRFHLGLLMTAGVYLAALLVSRLLGVIPAWFSWPTLLVVPGVALIVAVLWPRRGGLTEAAHAADEGAKTKDLFLTAAMIDHSLGEYKDLVLNAANEKAAQVVPARIVRFDWQRRAASGGGALAALCLGVFLLPQLDPFGKEKERLKQAEQHRRLAETIQATKLRAELLQKKSTDEPSKEIKAAIDDLLKTFKEAKPGDKPGNLKKLGDEQKELGQMWRKLSEEKLKEQMAAVQANQNFGLGDPDQRAQWKNDLQKGDTSSVQREMKDLQRMAQQLSDVKDPVEREKLRQELMNKLQNLQQAMREAMNSMPLDAALQRALEQMQMAESQGMSQDALDAMRDTLGLSEKEMERLAQAAKDMQQMQDALKALQMAKMLNEMGKLGEGEGQNAASLGDYLMLYAAMCQGQQPGPPGMGLGEGQGIGQRPHGDESQPTDYKPEQASSPLQPGKILMQWNAKGVSDPGQAREDYLKAVQDVRQKASEAVLQEQVPPGYHPAIKNYFDTFRNEPAPAPQQ